MHTRVFIPILAFCLVLGAAGSAAAQETSRCDAPQIMVVLDRSSSMGERAPLPDGTLKWDAATDALGSLTSSFDAAVDFGLLMFPSDDGECSPGRVDVPLARDNGGAIMDALGDAPPYAGFWTPMASSMRVAADYAPLRAADRRSFVVLITDGWEWCDPYDSETRFAPVEAVAGLNAAGITTYVIGFGGSVDPLTLNRAAFTAGTARAGCDPTSDDSTRDDNCYIQVDDLTELDAALTEVAMVATEEICDGLDNDCDGETDEELSRSCESDCGVGFEGCVDGEWTGCDAQQPSDEICDGLDNDCDGELDEGCHCLDDETRPCGTDEGECDAGTQSCIDGRWGPCRDFDGPFPGRCDGLDNDCDGNVDEPDEIDCDENSACVEGECVDLTEPPSDGPPPPDEEPPSDGPPPDDGNELGGDGFPGFAGGACNCHASGGRPAEALPALIFSIMVLGVAFQLRRR